MLKDTTAMNPKGRLKVELYNDSGVYFTKEKKNLVVQGANEIIANIMSNPSRKTRLNQVEAGDTDLTVTAGKGYAFPLTIQADKLVTVKQAVSGTNTEVEVDVAELKDITKLVKVVEGENELTINEDVFLVDAEEGVLEFATAPTAELSVMANVKKNELIRIIEGTQVVKVSGEKWKVAATPVDANKTYAIDYDLGVIYFENTKVNVSVTYDYTMNYGLGFMALGGIPEGHTQYKPVAFSDRDKLKTKLSNEFEDGRVPIIYPATVEKGESEIELLPTKALEYDEYTKTIVVADNDSSGSIDTIYQLDETGKPLVEIVSAKDITDAENPVDLEVGTDIKVETANEGKVKLLTSIIADDKFEVTFRIQKNVNHLNYQMSQSPILELVNVVHEDSFSGTKTNFAIEEGGLVVGEGDVWIVNGNAGIVQFSQSPSGGVPVQKPGQLTFEYKVNAGKVVKFIADFPKGVPGPEKKSKTETFNSTGETTFTLEKPVAKNNAGSFEVVSVKLNGSNATYSIQPDGTKLDVNSAISGDSVVIEYRYIQGAHEIYEVAMFDKQDRTNSTMFNISGIGPITKDEKTGMRVTWSVTF